MKASILGGALVAVLVSALPVSGAVAQNIYDQNASGTCNGALPAFDQSLRFRPLAVANEGTTNAFVSCTQLAAQGPAVDNTTLYLQNTGTASATINCTFVSGYDSGPKGSFPKAITLAAGETGTLTWSRTADNGGVNFPSDSAFSFASYSCNLPAKTELEFIRHDQTAAY